MTAAVQVTMNNLMTRYGAQTAYGGDVALSVYGMVMKVYQIAHAMFVGVSSATQPINGYNFGAKRYDRVRATYRMAATIALVVSVGWFAVYQLFPGPLAHCLSQGTRCTWTPASTSSGFTCWPFSSMGFTWPLPPFSRGLGDPCRLWPFPWSGRLWC
ncbi:MAG: MATE family efflux transporter [Evtepia gabavorous]